MNMSPLHAIRLLLLPSVLLAAALGAEPDADPLGPGGKAASDWIKTRLETARIESAWTSEQPLLGSTVNGLIERAQTDRKSTRLNSSHLVSRMPSSACK